MTLHDLHSPTPLRRTARLAVSFGTAAVLLTGTALARDVPPPRDARLALSTVEPVTIAPRSAIATRTFQLGLAALDRNDTTSALAALDALPREAVEGRTLAWVIALTGNGIDTNRYADLIARLPGWPGQITMRVRMERAVLRDRPDTVTLLSTFAAAPPRTDEGRLALADAYMAGGDTKAARPLVAEVWREADLDRSAERDILKRYGKLLTREDHRARVSRLLAKKRVKGAGRIAGKAGMKRVVAAAAAVLRKRRDATRKLDRVPRSVRGTGAHGYHLARHRQRNGRVKDAAAALIAVKTVMSDDMSDRLARQAHDLAMELIRLGDPRLAYRVATLDFGASPGRKADMAFRAGFIALRHRRAPGPAAVHFARLEKLGKRPLTLSRAAYWQGRAQEALGRKEKARAAFERAARYRTTFYGQLAAEKLGMRRLGIDATRATPDERTAFGSYEFVQAIALLEGAGEKRLCRILYRRLAQRLERPGEVALLAARAERQGDHNLGLIVGKTAAGRGLDVDSVAFPMGAITGSVKLSNRDLALAYAVARQESTFRIDARSPAGALGLMQLLPGTAKEVAKRVGLPYRRAKLYRDPAYNVRLGTAYLEEWQARLGGSVPLALVAYNAGPTRARNWSRDYGNPAAMSLDRAIDWIENIPFKETRNYVQRVMENHQVYRSRILDAPLNLGESITSGSG